MQEQDVDSIGQEAINEEGKTTVDEAIALIVISNIEAQNLIIGEKVNVSTKAFSPTIKKI